MAVYEKSSLLMCRDAQGNKYLLYPITKLDCVDGAEDLLHYGAAQDLTEAEQTQARLNIGAIPMPTTAKVGQFLRVAAVDAIGRVTAVEAVDWPGCGGNATVEDETLVMSGNSGMTVQDETLVMSSGCCRPTVDDETMVMSCHASIDGENLIIN